MNFKKFGQFCIILFGFRKGICRWYKLMVRIALSRGTVPGTHKTTRERRHVPEGKEVYGHCLQNVHGKSFPRF
jgi:hypothetical protein